MNMEDSHFVIDNIFKEGKCGLFSVLDGHGGSDVVEHCTKSIPDLFKKDYANWSSNIT